MIAHDESRAVAETDSLLGSDRVDPESREPSRGPRFVAVAACALLAVAAVVAGRSVGVGDVSIASLGLSRAGSHRQRHRAPWDSALYGHPRDEDADDEEANLDDAGPSGRAGARVRATSALGATPTAIVEAVREPGQGATFSVEQPGGVPKWATKEGARELARWSDARELPVADAAALGKSHGHVTGDVHD